MAEHEMTTGEHHEAHHHSDTVRVPLLGEVTVMGGIYTVVFGALAVLTLLEVTLAELFSSVIYNIDASGGSDVLLVQLIPGLKVAVLLAIGIAKSALVIMYYMHLKEDNRLFAVVLLVPLLIVSLSVLYLLAVPPTGYSLN